MTRTLSIIFATALLCLFFIGCIPAERPAPVLSSPAYYPLEVGTEWIYQGPGHLRIIKVLGHEEVGDKMAALVQTRHDEQIIAEEHIWANDKGVFGLTSGGVELPAPLPILRLPPTEGRTWRVNITKGGKKSQMVYKIGREEVQVPYGEFQAVTLRGEQYEAGERKRTFMQWFAKDVGVVKQSIVSPDEKIVYELVSFTRGK